jgi:hypothetical protein
MLIYRGKGSHLDGIPARDLSNEEVKKYGGEKKLIASKLYEKPKQKPKPDKGVNKASRSEE